MTQTSPSNLIPATLCFLVATSSALIGLCTALLQLIAYSNLDFSRTDHTAIFVVGWAFVLSCLLVAYQLFAHPSYRRLWFLVPCIVLFVVFAWLTSLPSAAHLMH